MDNQNYDVRINSLKTSGNTLASASVTVGGTFAVRGVRIMQGSNGAFVAMPSYKGSDGQYRDTCFPCTKEAKAEFDRAVLDEYQQALALQQEQHSEQPQYDGMNMG